MAVNKVSSENGAAGVYDGEKTPPFRWDDSGNVVLSVFRLVSHAGRKSMVFLECGKQHVGELRRAATSAPGDATGRDIVAIPVVDGQRFDAYACPGLGAVHKVVLTDVDTRMIAGTRNSEDDDIAGTQIASCDSPAGTGLIAADAGNGNAVAGAGPVDQSGAVEAPGRRSSAGNIGAAELAFGRGGYGGAGSGRYLCRRRGGAIVLFAAAGGHEHGCTQEQQGKKTKQGVNTKCRHGSPAEVERIMNSCRT